MIFILLICLTFFYVNIFIITEDDTTEMLYIITSKLHKTASIIGFIKKALHNNATPKFVQIKGQFLNKHEHI